MAFSDMNDVEQELGEEKPPERNGNRTFLIIAGTLGGIMVLALLCIAGLALYRYLPGQQAVVNQNATKAVQDTAAAQDTAVALSISETASVPTLTATRQPTYTPTNTQAPTKTPVLVIVPTKSPTLDMALVTQHALLTQTAQYAFATVTSGAPTSAATPHPTTTALPSTGIADELGTPRLLAIAFILIVVIFVVRGLRTAS
jgi:hypothetical protein